MKTFEHYPIIVNNRTVRYTGQEEITVLDFVTTHHDHREYQGEWCEVRFHDGTIGLIPAAAIQAHS